MFFRGVGVEINSFYPMLLGFALGVGIGGILMVARGSMPGGTPVTSALIGRELNVQY